MYNVASMQLQNCQSAHRGRRYAAAVVVALLALALLCTAALRPAHADETTPTAILYESGHLVLQLGDTLDPAEGAVKATYTDFLDTNQPGWLEYSTDIIKVTAKDTMTPTKIGAGITRWNHWGQDSWFADCWNLEEVYLAKLDFSQIGDFSSLFLRCNSLRVVDIDKWVAPNAFSTSWMFFDCLSLEELKLPAWRWNSNNFVSDFMFFASYVHHLDLTNVDFTNGPTMGWGDSWWEDLARIDRITFGDKRFFWNNLTKIPSGYTWISEQDGAIYTSEELMAAQIADPVGMAGSYHIYEKPGEYYANNLGLENMWRVDNPDELFKGYCINLKRNGVGGYYDRIEVTDDSVLDEEFLDGEAQGSTHGYAPLGNSMKEALTTLIYFGYNGTATGREIQNKYGLTDEEYMDVTQEAIWDFTDRYNAKRGPTHFTGAKLQAYNELTSKHYSDIPGEWRLYLYQANNTGRQNLLSIDGLEGDEVFGGIKVTKYVREGSSNTELSGAEFTIWHAASQEDAYAMNVGEVADVLVTGQDGTAQTGIRDLPEGWYVVKETKPPRGYSALPVSGNENWAVVHITSDRTMYEVGHIIADGVSIGSDFLSFFNSEDTSITGGGLVVNKTNADGSKKLAGAEFEIVDAQGQVVATIVSDADGEARTPGNKDLPFGTYTVRESKAPDGYKLGGETHTVTISENRTYVVDSQAFTNESKVGEVVITAKKNLESKSGKAQTIKAEQFSFELYDAEGTLLETVKCDAEGNVAFTKIDYTADDLGYKNYTIREVIPEDAVREDGTRYGDADPADISEDDEWVLDDVTYDGHEEWITVTIYDNQEEELVCEIVTDADGVEFTNKLDVEDDDEGDEDDDEGDKNDDDSDDSDDSSDDEGEDDSGTSGPTDSNNAGEHIKKQDASTVLADTADETPFGLLANFMLLAGGALLLTRRFN